MKIIIVIIAFFILLNLSACSREPKTPSAKMMTVAANASTNSLFYSGSIAPLKTVVVTSPADGAIIDMPFQYGEEIKPGQLLFMISSTKFLTDYKTALMQYVKAKNDFNNSQMQLNESEFLHKNQLISDDDYKMKKSNFYGNQLAFLQAKDTLENLLKQLGNKDINLYKLSISDIDKITKAMRLQMSSENLHVFSPAEGVILSPSKNEEENKKLAKGDVVKQGDVLAVIGDMKGVSVRIKVNELVVTQLKTGQKVKVTGIAFPEDMLHGQITRIDRQGEATNNGLPSFFVEVVVPTLTSLQQKKIHVGMSAKIQIDIEETPHMLIPISAISEKNGAFYVKMYEAKTKKMHDVEVKTGKTTPDSVAILSGLKVGDTIIAVG